MTPLDPATDTWTCCSRPRLTDRCTANPASYRYGDEPSLAHIGHTPERTCRDCAVTLGQHHHRRCCIAECRRCGGQQMMCGCLSPQLGAVR